MKRVALGVAVLFALVGLSLPSSAQQYWPNMRDFKLPSNNDVTDARVKAALKDAKYRAEVDALRKIVYNEISVNCADMDVKIINSLNGTLSKVDAYVIKLQKTTKQILNDKSYYRSAYSLSPIYEDINTFTAVSNDLNKYLFTVKQCSGALKAHYINSKVAENCKKVISDKTFAYAKIMELSFPQDDRSNFFSAKRSFAKQLNPAK